MPHGLDTDTRVDIYPCEFYPLHNFSAFKVFFEGVLFDTAEQAYQWMKFADYDDRLHHVENHGIRAMIRRAKSAHDVYQLSRQYKDRVDPSWGGRRVAVMKEILQAKVDQHEYVKRKLLETGDRQIAEVDWRDSSSFWGTGSDGDGENMLGRLWMEIRCEIRLGESGV
jgi:ribA/ribD-fused uncharacterized protein